MSKDSEALAKLLAERERLAKLRGGHGPTPKLGLTFQNAALKALLDDAEAKWPNGVHTLYEEVTGRGFWLVGDEGVYLMHNAVIPEDGPNPMVVYANECNPKTLDFDTWWSAKGATWGGDDGCEFLAEAELRPHIERGADLRFEFDGETMSIITVEATKQ